MSGKQNYLVVMSVPAIDQYVYGTDRLVEIRGASGLLDFLNRLKTAPFLVDCLGDENVTCVFAGGGEGQFIISAAREDLSKALHDLKAYFVSESRGGLRLFCGSAELDGKSYRDSLGEALIDLERDQEENPFSQSTPLHIGYIRECDSCSGMLHRPEKGHNDDRTLCKVCEEKAKHGRKRRLWDELIDHLNKRQWEVPLAFKAAPENFEEIGELCKAKRGYTALVYADGNSMSGLLREIEDEEQFQFFSSMMDQSIREACYEAIYRNCPPVKPESKDEARVPCDILLLGGDDLLVYMSADTAFPFVLDVARAFHAGTSRRFTQSPFFAEVLKGKGLTLSFGIAYGKSHTPFSVMFRQAKELLASAKQAGDIDPRHEGHYSPSYIDYHLTSYFNQLQVEQCRKMHLQLQGKGTSQLFLYRKPYSLEDASELLKHARKLATSGIPRSRLKRLSDSPSLGMMRGTLEFLKTYTRLDTRADEDRRRILWDALACSGCAGEAVPWGSREIGVPGGEGSSEREVAWQTALLDLIELTEFISSQES